MAEILYNIHIEWGKHAATRAARQSDILIIVDTLSFSTTIAAAVSNGLSVFPCATYEEAAILAQQHNCECSVARKDVPAKGKFSLSPSTIDSVRDSDAIVMRSVNGAAIVRASSSAPLVLVGTIVNAELIAEYVNSYCSRQAKQSSVAVIACGELVHGSEHANDFRFAIEDYLGAGAIISHMNGRKSAEAKLCERSFINEKDDLNYLLIHCESGVELCESGFIEDVHFAAKLNSVNALPMLVNDRICGV